MPSADYRLSRKRNSPSHGFCRKPFGAPVKVDQERPLTFNASIDLVTVSATTITHQDSFILFADGNGANEASGFTDAPVTGATADRTANLVLSVATPLPTLGVWMMLLLISAQAVRHRSRQDAARSDLI